MKVTHRFVDFGDGGCDAGFEALAVQQPRIVARLQRLFGRVRHGSLERGAHRLRRRQRSAGRRRHLQLLRGLCVGFRAVDQVSQGQRLLVCTSAFAAPHAQLWRQVAMRQPIGQLSARKRALNSAGGVGIAPHRLRRSVNRSTKQRRRWPDSAF